MCVCVCACECVRESVCVGVCACVCVFGVFVCVMHASVCVCIRMVRARMYIMSIVGIHVCIVRVYNAHTSTSMYTWNR